MLAAHADGVEGLHTHKRVSTQTQIDTPQQRTRRCWAKGGWTTTAKQRTLCDSLQPVLLKQPPVWHIRPFQLGRLYRPHTLLQANQRDLGASGCWRSKTAKRGPGQKLWLLILVADNNETACLRVATQLELKKKNWLRGVAQQEFPRLFRLSFQTRPAASNKELVAF